MASVEELEDRYCSDAVDDHEVFDDAVRRYLAPKAQVLDAGAGRGSRYPYDYRQFVERLTGVDLDPAVKNNPSLHESVIADLAQLPMDDATFDLVFSKYVFEHLTRPKATMAELRRVMKPGGHLVFQTPNRFHYVALGAMVTPDRFHVWFNARRGRVAADSYPTQYRINDRRTIRRIASMTGFRVVELRMIEPKPDYLTFHPLAYLAGVGYERAVNRWEGLQDLRCVIVGDLVAV